MKTKSRVLIIEDDPAGCRSVRDAVEDAGWRAEATMTATEGLAAFERGGFDAVLTDLVLPDLDGMGVLEKIQALDPTIPVLIMTAYGTVSSAVAAMKAGAYDYVTKPLDLDELQARLARALETQRLRGEVATLKDSVHGRYGVDAMVAESSAMKAVVEQILALADTQATVLIQGESGTGKEVVARALHAEGERRAGPFVAVNCGAFAESLLESELFGHEKGAFTGAAAQRKGAFERADGGTLFLDEIGNAPPSVQVKLLRVIQERELVRVGGQDTIDVNVRLVSASNRDLVELVEANEFREDLLYRLNVVTMHLPPLRERRADIRPLAERFLREACEANNRTIRTTEKGYYEALEQYEWPGNVRQLRNTMESCVVMSTSGVLETRHLQFRGRATQPATDWQVPEGKTLEAMEKEILTQLLQRHSGNRTLVADKLGIARRTIQRKIKDYDLPY
ncbi:MAG: sigma-54 dependent transcriptional regulator [Verrucomicrobia bacterium]|nr:sigma-54 dependent transcriptional regulator [Verrucomicrobiota bacterium]